MNKKSCSFDMETFRNMLLICPKLPGQKFVDPPFEEEILTFIKELGYLGNIKLLSDVKVDTLPQPWRTFGTIINKCLSGKVTGINTLRLSRAQILWGLYHQEKVDYVYLLWEDLVFHIENNEFIPRYEVVQRYGAILPDYLTNLAMKKSEAYKTYHDRATRKLSDEEYDDDEGKDKDDDDHDNDDEVQGENIEEEEIDEEATHDEDEANQSSFMSSGFVSNMLNPRPDTGIDSIFNLNTKATSLVDVPVTTIAEPPLVFATTLPLPPTTLITHMQQTPFLIPTTTPSTSLYDLPNFGSLFRFDNRLKALERDFLEFNQTNQFAEAISSILRIVDNYLGSKLKDTVDVAVQLKSDRIREET
ncbi:hypothetical protein Tco_0692439 [Tanacetum coccineum]